MSLATPRKGYKSVPWLFGKEIEIPEEWTVSRQGSVCEFINGYAYSEKEISKTGYPIIRIQNLSGGTNYVHSNVKLPEKQFAVEGDLLYAWSATFSPFIWHGKKSAFHYHQWKVIPNEQSDKMFLFYHFERVTPTIRNMGQSGLGMFHMTKNGMERFQFIKPPLPEQQKIANILSNVDNLIESTEKVITHSKKVKTGLMQKLLTQGIGHTKFKKVPWLFGEEIEIPEEWESDIVESLTILNEKGSIRMGPFGSSLKTQELLDSGNIKTLWIENIVNNEFTWDYQKFISEKKYEELKGFTVKPNDVLITMMGTLGRVAIVPENIGTAIISSHLLKISLDPKKANPSFLFYVLKSHFILRQIIKESRGLVMGGLNTGIIKKLQIPVPPLPEQQKIATILSNIDSKITSQEQYKEKLEKLKKALMQKLLTGEIRVKL